MGLQAQFPGNGMVLIGLQDGKVCSGDSLEGSVILFAGQKGRGFETGRDSNFKPLAAGDPPVLSGPDPGG